MAEDQEAAVVIKSVHQIIHNRLRMAMTVHSDHVSIESPDGFPNQLTKQTVMELAEMFAKAKEFMGA